jgi:hypothetical protein
MNQLKNQHLTVVKGEAISDEADTESVICLLDPTMRLLADIGSANGCN